MININDNLFNKKKELFNQRYFETYKNNEIFQSMYSSIVWHVSDKDEHISRDILNYPQRERLKKQADKLAKWWFIVWALMMKEIAHWNRYLETNVDKPMDIIEYIHWKYTNPELFTY